MIIAGESRRVPMKHMDVIKWCRWSPEYLQGMGQVSEPGYYKGKRKVNQS